VLERSNREQRIGFPAAAQRETPSTRRERCGGMTDGIGIIEEGEFRFFGYDEVGDLLLDDSWDGAVVRAYPRESFAHIVPVNADTLEIGTYVAVEPLVGGKWVVREFCDCTDPECLGIACRWDWSCDCGEPSCPAARERARVREPR
jgi:hypothetical protein